MKPNTEQLIEQLVQNTRELLEANWNRAEAVFTESNIKLSLTHLIDFEHSQIQVKSTIAYGARVKDTREVMMPDGEQDLPLEVPKQPKRARSNGV